MVTFDFAIDIVKLDNSGQIAIYNTVTGDFITSYSPDNVKITTQTTTDTVKVTFDNNDAVYFRVDLVANTEIEPAAPVPFVGDVYDLAELLATDFFFEVGGGGGGSQDLASVLIAGNTSGANDIIFDTLQGLEFANASRLREGTIDAGLGGAKGIAQICAVGYELKWEAGRLYVMDGNGLFIRRSLYNFDIAPTVNDDDTKGYYIGSLWSLDDGTVYECSDATSGAAVWAIQKYNFIGFDTTAAHTVAVGELAWNDALGTLDLGLKGGNTISNLGQHIHTRVVNKTVPLVGLTKAGYEVVIIAGATGQRLSVKLAKADNDANSAGTLGIVCENIAGNQEGFICSIGQVTDINTTGSLQGETWADGDLLYLSGTTFGAITNVKPTAPIHEVRIGYVEYAHAVNGKIYVKIDNGYELDELHNVSINAGTLANNDVLTYESSTQLWINKTITTALGFTPVPQTRTLTINGSTQDLSANRTFTIADPSGWSVIVKSANQDVTNSITLVDDTDLQFSVVAGGQYMIEMDIVISCNNTSSDYLSRFAVSAGNMKGNGIYTATGLTGLAVVTIASAGGVANTNQISMGCPSADLDSLLSIKIIYSFTASANAIFKYQFAQNVAIAATTARTFKGSILKYKKIN